MATTQKRYFPKTNEELKELVKDENIHLGEIDVSGVEDMSGVFSDSQRQNFEGLESWDVSKVKNMTGMFAGAKHFNHDISSWDVSKVNSMKGMFSCGCKNFNQPLDKWDV
ncbi:BspA family leucine-rich repeat surface protein, partial [Helicobacter ailurogastricus]